jgi:hypothetical protein
MSQYETYRRPARGRPAIGFQLETPREVQLREGSTVLCRETRQDGRVVGELEISVFAAALVIDRDGILEEKACAGIATLTEGRGDAAAVAVRLPGAAGFRAEAVHGTELPYLHAFAVAPSDLGVDGGLLITVRSAAPDWAAADHMLRSLRLLTRSGMSTVSDDADEAPLLPVVAPSRR